MDFLRLLKKTAGYLNMNYKGDAHAWIADGKIPDEVEERLILFCEKIGNESQL